MLSNTALVARFSKGKVGRTSRKDQVRKCTVISCTANLVISLGGLGRLKEIGGAVWEWKNVQFQLRQQRYRDEGMADVSASGVVSYAPCTANT